jgi:germacradienol/geosmin synthase
VRRNNKDWARRMGMLDELPGVPGGYIWDDRKFDAADVALCGALIHPDGSLPALDITAAWLVWGTYADDYFPALYGRTRDMAGAKVFNARLSELMPIDHEPVPPPMSPVERGLADIWARTAVSLSKDTRRRFRRTIEDMTESWLWELANQMQNRIPDPVDYIEMRRKTFGSDLTASLARLRLGDGIPAALLQTRALRGIECSAQDYACLTNDVFSYRKEIEFEGELHNGVLVVRQFLECDSAAAVGIVNDLMTARMQQFEHLIATELPAVCDTLDLDKVAREQLRRYISGLQDWVSGILRWHQSVDRYKESELRRSRPPAPAAAPAPALALQPQPQPGSLAGLGTSAARIAELIRGRL